jgi:hypothetical protein
MLDFQKTFDAMSAMDRETRSKYHLTLSELIEKLEEANKELPVKYIDEGTPLGMYSYRGYYSDLCFSDGDYTVNVGLFLDSLKKNAINKTFVGYKGGDFLMGPETPLWRSIYGESTGIAIIDAQANHDSFLLITKDVN